VSLEPAGQLELSGAPLATCTTPAAKPTATCAKCAAVAEPMGLGFLGMGFQPKWRRDEMPWMPKGRYKIMREYMPKVGSLGLDMMTRTCTVQVNLDVGSEADMVKKFRVSLALQPIATALFADSPFTEGKPNGYLSYRSHIWTDTDAGRTGLLDFVFETASATSATSITCSTCRCTSSTATGKYIEASGPVFPRLPRRQAAGYPGRVRRCKDWADHSTTAFPEVRLKKYLEMRGADSGPWNRICALSAFWVGLLYDQTAARCGLGPGRRISSLEGRCMRCRNGRPRRR
jgi:glutamate--cysteine ligase